MAMTSATKFISPITTKKNAIIHEIIDAFIGSIVLSLFLEIQLFKVIIGKILSTPSA